LKSRGFTLLEVLVSIMVLTIGFSALYFWFQGYGSMAKRDRVRVEAYQILHQQVEYGTAYPRATVDSTWVVNAGIDSFLVQQVVLDSLDAIHIADSLGLGSAAAERFATRPKEVNLHIQQLGASANYRDSIFFVVGGVVHVAP